MSKSGALNAPVRGSRSVREEVVFIPGEDRCELNRAPSVAAKLRLVARSSALAALVAMRSSYASASPHLRVGGAYRDRTDDLKLAKLALSQLS